VRAKGTESLSREQMSELLKLRGEVGRLRRESKELETLQAENRQLRRPSDESPSNQGTNKPPIVAKIVVTHIKQPQAISEEKIRTNISVKVGDIFDRAAADRDVRSLYGTGWFSNLRIDDSTSDQGVILNYLVQEKPKLSRIRFVGNTNYREADLAKILTSKVGEPLDERMLFDDAQRVRELYGEAGFSGTKVKTESNVNEDAGVGEVIFDIAE
jgi:outer membrane protein assembly factor BamA